MKQDQQLVLNVLGTFSLVVRQIFAINKNLILVTKYVVVNIEFPWRLWNQNETLHEPAHWFPIVRQLARDLDSNHEVKPVGYTLHSSTLVQ